MGSRWFRWWLEEVEVGVRGGVVRLRCWRRRRMSVGIDLRKEGWFFFVCFLKKKRFSDE